MSLTVRTLAFDDLDLRTAYDLWRLRQDVFVVEQASIYNDLDGRDLEPTTRHLLLEEDGVLIGCLRLLDDGDWSRIGRVVVTPSARGRGLGARLMDDAMTICGEHEVRLDSQSAMTGFYAGYGFEVEGPVFDDGGIPHVPMRRPAQS